MKKPAITPIALFAALVVSTAADAASYDYTAHYSDVGRPALADAQIDAQLQADTATCDDAVAPVAVDQRFQALITFTNNSLEFAGDRWHNKGSTNSKSYAAVSNQHAARRDPSFSIVR